MKLSAIKSPALRKQIKLSLLGNKDLVQVKIPGKRGPSPLETRFRMLWLELDGPALTEQFKFCKTRKWRSDFCHESSKTIVEVEGGIYIPGGGRHNRPEGYKKDRQKYNTANILGYAVFCLTDSMITAENLIPIIDRCNTTKTK